MLSLLIGLYLELLQTFLMLLRVLGLFSVARKLGTFSRTFDRFLIGIGFLIGFVFLRLKHVLVSSSESVDDKYSSSRDLKPDSIGTENTAGM